MIVTAVILLVGTIWRVTRQKVNIETGISAPEEIILEDKNKIKARLTALKAVSLEPNGETTDYVRNGTTEVWMTESNDPIYDTTFVVLEEKE